MAEGDSVLEHAAARGKPKPTKAVREYRVLVPIILIGEEGALQSLALFAL
jgi:hypothetical protein